MLYHVILRTFKEHHVTGYDFPELVENKGQALKDELNIDLKFRTKIIRAVNGRMFGIGKVPLKPDKIFLNVESCSTISLNWTKSQTNSLPVHKYKVTRRKIGGSTSNINDSKKGNHSKIPMGDADFCNESNDFMTLPAERTDHPLVDEAINSDAPKVKMNTCALTLNDSRRENSISEWKTVHDGSENECVDTGLERGKAYIYRIQAWNLVGKSEWAVLDPTEEWVAFGCNEENPFIPNIMEAHTIRKGKLSNENTTTQMKGDSLTNTKEAISLFSRFFKLLSAWGVFIAYAVSTLGALSTTLLRLRRATVTSTAARIEPFFPWAFKHVNEFFKKTIGITFIPEIFTIGRNEALIVHDNVINSVGLNGYMVSPPGINSADRSYAMRDNRLQSEPFISSNTKMNKTEDTTKQVGAKVKKDFRPGPFSRKRSLKTSLPATKDNPKKIQVCEKTVEAQTDLTTLGLEDENKCIQITKGLSSRSKPPSKLKIFGRTSKIKVLANNTDSNRQKGIPSDEADTISYNKSESTRNHSNSFDSIDRCNRGMIARKCEDHNLCNSCQKKYKFPRRCRHHCARCGETFCHKHGKTTHPNIVPCKVPGDCVCNVCLED